MSLTTQRTLRCQGAAIAAISSAVAVASSASAMYAPSPKVTSRAMAPAPPAMARLMTDAATRPDEGVVAVASRSSASRRSAGVSRALGAATAMPTSRTWRTKRASGRSASKPGIASSLSMMPPAWPSPRLPVVATRTPSAAASGAAAMGAVSPTPPVLWRSPAGPSEPSSSRSPEAMSPRVRASTCSRPIPVRHAAMHHAAISESAVVRSIQERTNDSTLAASTGSPRRVRSITSRGASCSAMDGRHSTPAPPARGDRPPGPPAHALVGCRGCFAM